MLALFYQIFTFANVTFMLKGLAMSVAIAVLATVISMFFGTILALIRTYANGPFQWASALVAVYTEFFRCTPNLLWILWIYFTIKGNKIAVSVFAISLFTSAVMAEIFRGGLNSIPKGQFEAAQSQGFSFLQTLWYIVLPQTYKKVIRNCAIVMGSIYDVRGMIMLLAFEAICYFVICFTLSCVVRGYQKTIVTA